jgi:hypothetical protein
MNLFHFVLGLSCQEQYAGEKGEEKLFIPVASTAVWCAVEEG